MPAFPTIAIAMIVAFEATMIKTPSAEIAAVLPLKNRAVMPVIVHIAVMPAPGRVAIILIARVIPFINPDLGMYAYLRFGRIHGKASGHYHKENQ